MKKRKILTISVAAYNAERTLDKCLASFAVPDLLEKLEIIVVNDGSTDATAAIAEGYCRKYPNSYRLINKKNGGHGSTINTSVREATGKYFKIVDADDWVEEKGLRELVENLAGTAADAVFSPYFNVLAKNQTKSLVKCCGGNGHSELKEELFGTEIEVSQVAHNITLCMHMITFRTEFLKESPYCIDENCFYVDVEYLIFYFLRVRKILILKEPVYDYFIGTEEQSMSVNNLIKRREQHLTVCHRIIEFYESEKNHMDESVRRIIKEKIRGVICYQYKIFMSISNLQTSLNECKSFDEDLCRHYKEFYREVLNSDYTKTKFMILVMFIRILKFRGYSILHMFIKKCPILP